jgi:hypothetical protein
MSRTIRKVSGEYTEHEAMREARRRYSGRPHSAYKRRRLTKEELQARREQSWNRYCEAIAKLPRNEEGVPFETSYVWVYGVDSRIYKKYTYTPVVWREPSERFVGYFVEGEEGHQYNIDLWVRHCYHEPRRRGSQESIKNGDFKRLAKKHQRRADRDLCHKILRDEDGWDEKPYYDRKHGKKFIWSVW